MRMNVVVPDLGPSIEDAILVKWLVREGDFVRKGTPIFSVETDKTIVDCESGGEGYVGSIAVAEGDTVRVHQVLAVLTDAADPSSERPDAPREPAANAEPESGPRGNANVPEEKRVDVTGRLPASAPHSIGQEARRDNEGEDPRLRASPRARRMAREIGVDVEGLRGSGPMGRIVRRDVEAFVAGAIAGAARGPATGPGSAAPTGRTRDVPLSTMRRTIARRMTDSAQSTPVFFATAKIGCEALLAMREQLRRVPGLAISINDVILKACAIALRKCPGINATFHGDFVRLHEDVDIAVAVALEDGLITPIVRNVDGKRLAELSAEVRSLTEKARTGRLPRHDYEGGTFTVSNLGMHGLEAFTAIINPPQCAILAIGAIDVELYLDAGAIRERRMLKATLSADHRVVDGALAARFLEELKTALENPACVLEGSERVGNQAAELDGGRVQGVHDAR